MLNSISNQLKGQICFLMIWMLHFWSTHVFFCFIIILLDFLPLKTFHWACNASVTLLCSWVSESHSYKQARWVSWSNLTLKHERKPLDSMYVPSSAALSIDTRACSHLHSPVRPKAGSVNQMSCPREHGEVQESPQGSDTPLSQNPPWRAERRGIYTDGYDFNCLNI